MPNFLETIQKKTKNPTLAQEIFEEIFKILEQTILNREPTEIENLLGITYKPIKYKATLKKPARTTHRPVSELQLSYNETYKGTQPYLVRKETVILDIYDVEEEILIFTPDACLITETSNED